LFIKLLKLNLNLLFPLVVVFLISFLVKFIKGRKAEDIIGKYFFALKNESF
jgi:hypothetical protein